ncbi:MAG: leucine-rich repeat domain-containing protein [Phycisphaerae bacterium]|nr:leucine-rich repeat domain-containing protein [Saprospiraceae bacterium]
MKRSLPLLLLHVVLLAALPADLAGQTLCGEAYTRMIAEGDAFLKKGNYKDAFEKYRAARGCSEAEHQVLDKKTADVLHAVDGEREKAAKNATMARRLQRKAEAALQKAEEATAKAETAEKKAAAVLDKIYFYEDRFGLAYENNKYGFIDKNLNTKIDFKYMEAMPFDYTGFAWVKRLDDNRKQVEFVIDTLGKEYTLAYDVTEMKETTEALDLRNRDLDTLPQAIFGHTQLKILMLAGNQLKQLPPEIGNLKNLIFLGLSRNRLEQLPPQLGNLENLKTLQVFSNQLVQLPQTLGNLKNLTLLDLSSNQLTQLPPALGNLEDLIYLRLDNNQLNQLPQELGNLKNLRTLRLDNNQLTQLPHELGNLKNLNTLSLSDNRLTRFPPELGNLTNLKWLNLSGNILTQLPAELSKLKNLKSLRLNGNPLGETEARRIRTMLPKSEVFQRPVIVKEKEEHVRKRNEYAQEILKKESKLQAGDTTISQAGLADSYNSLAWQQLLSGQFPEAEQSIRRGLECDPSLLILYTNLPPSLLFQSNRSKEDEAIRLYTKWKDRDFLGQKFGDFFLSDFKEFESEGIIPPSRRAAVARVKKLLQE